LRWPKRTAAFAGLSLSALTCTPVPGVESTAPRELVVQTEGTDSVTKSAMQVRMTVTLTEPVENRTELGYHASVEIKGRLAILGDMVLRATAVLLLEEFSRRLRKELEG
jgi:carbon monoxide dehydrogenase subunit G